MQEKTQEGCRLNRYFWVILCVLFIGILSYKGGGGSVSANSYPGYTVSYYMNTIDTTATYNMGHSLGEKVLSQSGTQNVMVILDFGGQNSYGNASLFWATDATLDQVRKASYSFAEGFYYGAGSDVNSRLYLVVGTNNSYTVTSSTGSAWANMVDNIGSDLGNHSYNTQTIVYGGNDMEAGSGYSGPAATKNWIAGYDSTNNHLYVDFGDAGGCTTSTTYTGSTNGKCNQGKEGDYWYMSDVYYKAWGASPALPLPQIYFENMAVQWKNIKKYGIVNNKGTINFKGSLTQQGACSQSPDDPTCPSNSPYEGWSDLYNKLYADTQTRQTTLQFASDIRWR